VVAVKAISFQWQLVNFHRLKPAPLGHPQVFVSVASKRLTFSTTPAESILTDISASVDSNRPTVVCPSDEKITLNGKRRLGGRLLRKNP
jgi:hypothetical protein